ncbi:T9SS type A sorting domain-containing protein [Lacinutrix cladophorae]
MKNKLLLLFVLIATFGYAQNVNIPDANFKAYLVGNTSINTNGDSEIQVSEASVFTGEINCYSLGINDLTGIGAFTALTQLNCVTNQLTSLDLSANTALTSIDCRDNQLTSINLPSSTALTELKCGENQITSLDVSANTALTNLSCYTNQLTSLDVSSNTALTELDFDTNPITSIDVSANTALVRLAISRTQLTSIDVSTNTALEDFFATDCQLTSLDVSAQPNLVLLWCNENQLTSLNIANGNNANMTSFYATDNTALTCIEVDAAIAGTSPTDWYKDAGATYSASCTTCTVNIPDANFKAYLVGNTAINTNGDTEIQCSEATAFSGIINCTNLNISDLTGVEAFTALTELYCQNNQLTSLDVSANTSLQYLFCGFNQLTSLDVSSNTALITIDCTSNQLTSLDGSVSTALTQLKCQNNQLTSLDVSNNTALINFECYNNSITSLDLSANTALTSITSYANNLVGLNIANGFNANLTFLSTGNNPSLTCIQVDANIVGTSPNNWYKDAAASYSDDCTPCTIYIPDANFKAALVGDTAINTNGDTEIQCSEATDAIGTIHAYNDNISDLTGIEAFTNITGLYCYDNNLTSLDVSANIFLIDLFCDNNNLTSLNIANGNNANMINFDATSNATLTCIQVDAGFTPNSAGWQKDAMASYSDNCTTCNVNIPDANFKAYLVGNTAINTNGDTEIQCSEATAFTGLIDCRYYNIIDLTGIEVFTNLTELVCNSNLLTSLNVSANINLTKLYCYNNQITSLDVSANTALIEFDSSYNPITSLDVSSNIYLESLFSIDNQLASLDVSTNTSLSRLDCSNNQLTSLDVSANTALTELSCINNQLTSLNIANGNNANITTMNASQNTNLTCIEVDAAIVGTSPAAWLKDATATYSLDCGALSVEDFSLNTVSIYPNPSTSVLNIKMNQGLKQATIYSMLGKQVLRTQNNNMDVSSLPNGMYIIKMEAKNGNVFTKQFIKI